MARKKINQALLPPQRGPDPEPVSGEFLPNTHLQNRLEEQHPIHALFGRTFEALGGEDRLTDWADDNYERFVTLFAKMAPAPKGETGPQAIQIQIHNSLGPSPLDG